VNRRRLATVAVLVVLLGSLLPGGPLPAAAAPAFTKTETISRTHLKADGTDDVVDTRTFSVSVSQTQQLRGQQQVEVQWTGAHPSLGIVTDPSSKNAYLQEYPVALMECRGDDSAANPVDPSTCWTEFIDQRQYETYATSFPPWRMDRQESAANRAQHVGYPDPLPANCFVLGQSSRHVPFVAADATHTAYRPINPASGSCGPTTAPEMVDVEDTAAPPANTTFAVTNADGTGSAKFVIWTEQENASLGCSPTVPCSLVVIPIMGISCDLRTDGATDFDRTACQAKGKNGVRQVVDPSSFTVDEAVTGEFWWSASNWRNRVVVPLGLGTPGGVCDTGDNRVPLDIFGSELMTQATTLWAPAFCLDPTRFKFRHVRIGEPAAKSALVNGGAEAALVSTPPPDGYPKPTVNAPVAVTGFAVSYIADSIAPDGSPGDPYHSLKLNPRLLAKLLAESYVPALALRDEYATLPASDPYSVMAHNPIDLSNDPEFIALNPGVGNHNLDAGTSATLLAISSNSDVIYALTSYINADPEARAWLDGTPDPWGMVVNPGYKGIALPQPTWPLADTYVPKVFNPYGCADPILQKAVNPVPFLPMVASPVPSLSIVAQRVQFAISNAHTKCQEIRDLQNAPVAVDMLAAGRQGPGRRLMLGITSLADAQFLELDTAALQSTATVANPSAKFTDASGRTFVAPTNDSLKAAIAFAKPDGKLNVWTMPYDTLRTAQGAQAYPGTMPVYLSVPTTGLPAEDATRLSQLIRFAAGDGQTAGTGNGQLPPGYLPMTAADGLASFVAYDTKAADAVAAQQSQVPSVTGAAPSPSPTTAPAGAGGTGAGGGVAGAGGGVPNAGPPVVTQAPSGSAGANASASPGAVRSLGLTAALSSALGRWALPIVALIALVTFIAGIGTRIGLAIADWVER
jgi:hypothetical protein